MKRIFCLLLVLMLVVLTFASCTDVQTYDSDHHPDISFSVSRFDTNIKVGETITVRAFLTNESEKDITISHLPLLIWLRVKKEGGELEGSTMAPMLTQTVIESGKSVEKSANFKFTEAGIYYLYAQASFNSTDEKSESFSYNEVIKITVTE